MPRTLAGRLAAVALACFATPAVADFIPTTGTAEYTTPTNWTAAAINGRFTAPGTNNLTVTFAADWPQTVNETGLLFNYGNGAVTLQSADATPRLLTLNGNVVTGTSTTGNAVTIGGTTNPLNLDLGGANRTFGVAAGDSLTVRGAVNGAGFGIVKDGAGTLFLAGDSNGPSGYGGAVTALTINAGTVSTGGTFADNSTAPPTIRPSGLGQPPGGATTGNIIINGGATLQWTGPNASVEANRGIAFGPGNATIEVTQAATNLTVAGIIADNGGAGRLVKTGSGELVLTTSTNTYSGGTSILEGVLSIASNARLGASPTLAPDQVFINAGATLRSTGSSVSLPVNRGITIGPATGTGDAFVDAGDEATDLFAFDGVVRDNPGGSARLVKTGPGILRLAGGVTDTGANTFTGGILVTEGTLRLRAVGVAGTGPGGGNGLITLQGAGSVLEPTISANRTFNADVLVNADAAIQGGRNSAGPGVSSTFGTLAIGGQTLTVRPGFNTTAETAYTIAFAGATTLTGSPTFVVNNNGTGLGTFALNGPVNGGFGLTKAGPGTMVLGGANTYTGPTTVTGGTLTVAATGSIANSSSYVVGTGAVLDASAAGGLAVGTGKTLSGAGSVVGPITLGGTVAPGNSIGTLTVTEMAWQPGGDYVFEHDPNASGTPGTTHDFINGSGVLNLSGLSAGSPFDLTLVPTGSFPATPTPQTYVIATFAGGMGVSDNTNVSSLFNFEGGFSTTPVATVIGAGGTAQSLQLQFTPVPEPGSILLACGGAAGLAAWRRNRRPA